MENRPQEAKCKVCNKFMRAKYYNLRIHKDTKEHRTKADEFKNGIVFLPGPGRRFNDNWLIEDEFQGWLEKCDDNPSVAKCKLCCRFIKTKRHNLVSHSKSEFHKNNVLNYSVKTEGKSDEEEIVLEEITSVFLEEETHDQISSSSDGESSSSASKPEPSRKKRYPQYFRKEWLHHPAYEDWLQEDENDKKRCSCKFCNKTLIAKRSGLEAHLSSTNHVKNSALISSIKTEVKAEPEEIVFEEIYLDEKLEQSSSSSDDEKPSRKNTYPQYFRQEWLNHPDFKDWLQEDENDKKRCSCKICNKKLIAKRSVLETHLASKVHKNGGPPIKPVKQLKERKQKDGRVVQHFRDEWLQMTQFKNWLQRIEADPTRAFCTVCNMSLRAKKFNLEDHCRRVQHRKLVEHPELEILPSHKRGEGSSRYFFNEDWLDDQDFAGWLRNDEQHPGMVICIVCKRQLTANKLNLKQHATSKTHIWRVEQEDNLKQFFSNFTES